MKTKAYVESLKAFSQICACDPCNSGTYQLILKGGGGEGAMEFREVSFFTGRGAFGNFSSFVNF